MKPGFTGSRLDRVDHIRADEKAYDEMLSDWRGRVLALDGMNPLVSDEGALKWQTMADLAEDAELILLGVADGKPHFVPVTDARGDAFRSPALWRALSMLPGEDAATSGTARSLIDWHNAHGYCAACGGSTQLFRAGWGRKCTSCEKEHYPRTDPVVIMLAEYEGKVLIGRQPRFPPGSYSALAGFLEPGESIEEAVRREIQEEAGVATGDVRYVTSQPWPFGGSQLMIACVAAAKDDALTLDKNELEDAIWVSRADIQAAFDDAPDKRFNAPPPFAVAHSLLRAWFDEGTC